MTEFTDVISAVGSIIGGIAAAVGLFYVAFQFKKSVKEQYYQTLSDIASKIEAIETDPDRNYDHRTIAMKYLNLFDRVASFARTGFIDKEIARFFVDNFRQAMGILKMEEYAKYRKSFPNLEYWCNSEKLDPSPPMSPYPNIYIVTDNPNDQKSQYQIDPHLAAHFESSSYHARVGDFVTWINDDTKLHTITSGTGKNDSNAGKEFDSQKLGTLALTEKGRKFSHEFTTKGTFRYFCREHPTEVGEVVIEEEDTKTNTPKVDSFNAKDLELCLKAPIAEVRLKPPISQTSQVTGKDDTQSTTPTVDMATSCLPSRFVECVNVLCT